MPVPAPWARPGSGFTLLFEAWAVEMARHLPVSTLAEQLDETDTRLWRSVAHYVDEARRLEDYMGVEAIGIDETSLFCFNVCSTGSAVFFRSVG